MPTPGVAFTASTRTLSRAARAMTVRMPDHDASVRQRVVLLVDGLGHHQLRERTALAPTLTAMRGSVITSVAPTTTATALTSLSTGMTPGEHGIVGYRMDMGASVMNSLSISSASMTIWNSVLSSSFSSSSEYSVTANS